jgi:replication factor A1
MHKIKDELYDSIKDLKTRNEFEEEIKKRYQENEGLLDEDTIALFIIDELGRNNKVISKISDLKPDSEYTVVGKITNIYDPKSFKRKNGTSGKVINLDISDDTGTCRLVLWNKDVEQVKNKEIVKGTSVKIINGYTKNGYSGLEINLGRWGLLEVKSNNQIVINEVQSSSSDYINGILIHRESTRAFFRDNGEFGFVTTIKIKEKGKEKQITIWDEKVKEIQKFKIGQQLIIKNVTIKQNNSLEEIHVNGNSTIQRI